MMADEAMAEVADDFEEATEEATGATEEIAEEAADASAEAAETPSDWRDVITDANLRKQAERFPGDPAAAFQEALKGNLDMRQQLSKAVFVPGKDADEKQVAAFRKAIGVPEKIEDYKIDFPEGVDETSLDDNAKAELKAIAELALAHNVPTDAFKALAKWDMERAMAKEEAAVAEDKKFADDATKALKEKWGAQAPREFEYANRGAEKAFQTNIEAFRQLKTKDDRLVADHPIIVEAMNWIGRMTSEDSPMNVGPVDEAAASNLREELNHLTAEQDDAMRAGDLTKAKAIDRKIEEVARKISGDNPIVGAA